MIIKKDTIELAKDNKFEIKTTKMGLNRIASIIVDDIKGLTEDKKLKRLIIINEIYLEICNSGELGLTENTLNNKIKEGINKFLNSNSSVYLSSIYNKNINLEDTLSLCDYLNNQSFDNKVYLKIYNLLVNKDKQILDSSKKFKEKDEVKNELEEMLSQKIYKDSEVKKLSLDLETIMNSEYYTIKTHKFVESLKKAGFSIEEIRYILDQNCKKDLVNAFDKKEELRIKNKERSLYLKRKYGTKS